jgi:hypothetical protein
MTTIWFSPLLVLGLVALTNDAAAQPHATGASPSPQTSLKPKLNDDGPNVISLGISASQVLGVYARIHPFYSKKPLLSGLSFGLRSGSDFGEFRSLSGYGADLGYGVISPSWRHLRGGVMANVHMDRWKIYVESPVEDEFTGSGVGYGASLRLFGQFGPVELSVPIEIGRFPSKERYLSTGLMLGFGFVSTPSPGAIE